MGLSQYGYMVLIYCLSSVLLVGLTIYAFVCGWLFRRKNSTAEAFITARGQVWREARAPLIGRAGGGTVRCEGVRGAEAWEGGAGACKYVHVTGGRAGEHAASLQAGGAWQLGPLLCCLASCGLCTPSTRPPAAMPRPWPPHA